MHIFLYEPKIDFAYDGIELTLELLIKSRGFRTTITRNIKVWNLYSLTGSQSLNSREENKPLCKRESPVPKYITHLKHMSM